MFGFWGDTHISSLLKLSDETLSERVKLWDNQAFEVLYDRYKDKIFSYIWNILNYNTDDASNVLSDVFIKIFEYCKINQIQNFKTLLYRFAHNTCVDWIRTNKSWFHVDEQKAQLREDIQDSIEKENLNTKFKQEIMMKYLSQLDEKFRNVLYLYYYECKSYDEISQIIWSNKNTVWTMIFNAKKELKQKIKDQKVLKELMI